MKKLLLFTTCIVAIIATSYSQNTSYGDGAGTGGTDNTFYGANAGQNAGGTFNIGIGKDALLSVPGSMADGNISIGNQSGKNITSGNYNFFAGFDAGALTSTGSKNVFLGYSSGKNNTTGNKNVYIGTNTGIYNVGSYNVAIGDEALAGNQINVNTGSSNLALGSFAGYGITTGGGNFFGGFSAGINTTEGSNNVFLGTSAGGRNITGSNNIYIGNYAGASAETNATNKFILSNNWYGNPLIFGDFSTNQLAIGSKILTPGYNLIANGGLLIKSDDNAIIPSLNVRTDGNVSIGTFNVFGGTTDPYKLTVDGKIRCTALRVTTSWADYVFEDSYKLRSLQELEQYIKENKHLPDVPTAASIEEKGADVGEMQKIMMQKIEELTLYIIQQQKVMDEQQKQIDELKTQIK